MGHTGNPAHPDVQQAIERAIKTVVDAGRVAGTLVNDSNVDGFVEMGVKCLGVPWPIWVAQGAENFLQRVGR